MDEIVQYVDIVEIFRTNPIAFLREKMDAWVRYLGYQPTREQAIAKLKVPVSRPNQSLSTCANSSRSSYELANNLEPVGEGHKPQRNSAYVGVVDVLAVL